MTFTKNKKNQSSANCNSFDIELGASNYIASCDVGTTTIRCFIYKTAPVFSLCGSAVENITLLSPKPGYLEIDPHILWEKFTTVINKAIEDSNVSPPDITCLGISTQRATFILWDGVSGEPLHNFITWKDMRADDMVNSYNRAYKIRLAKFGSGVLHFVTRKKRFLAASIIKFQNIQVNIRLKWMLENDPKVMKCLQKGNLMFGTIDTWLVYKLTGGKVHATDHSNASGTAIYDPFILEWSKFLFSLVDIPSSIFPEIRDSIGYWGEVKPELFGAPLPITAVISDQGAALFGGCGFLRGDVKATLGTGAFLDINTGKSPHTSLKGIYPVVGWKDPRGIVYMAEGASNDNGTVIEWGIKMGFYEHPSETSEMAFSVPDTDGVYFIPGFQGIQAPINDSKATGGFIGLTINSRREHLVRAMLESLAFRVCLIYQTMNMETSYEIQSLSKSSPFRVDGGVSQNDFILQTIATLTEKRIERSKNIEASSLGCCFMAGLGAGIWKDYSEVAHLKEVDKIFEPDYEERPRLLRQLVRWKEALKRFTNWTDNSRLDTKDKISS